MSSGKTYSQNGTQKKEKTAYVRLTKKQAEAIANDIVRLHQQDTIIIALEKQKINYQEKIAALEELNVLKEDKIKIYQNKDSINKEIIKHYKNLDEKSQRKIKKLKTNFVLTAIGSGVLVILSIIF